MGFNRIMLFKSSWPELPNINTGKNGLGSIGYMVQLSYSSYQGFSITPCLTFLSSMFCLFGVFSPLNPSDLKKDSSVLHISKSQGRYGSTPSPQPKLPSQHPLQKQGNSNTDKTQVVQLHTANGVVAQDQTEDEDRRLPDRVSAISTLVPDNAVDNSLINGERESTSRESLQSMTACEGQMLNSCYRTPSSDTLLPSENETLEINTNVKEEPTEEMSKQDQPVETKVKREIVSFLLYYYFVYFLLVFIYKNKLPRAGQNVENLLFFSSGKKDREKKKILLAFSPLYYFPSLLLRISYLRFKKKVKLKYVYMFSTVLQLCQTTRDTG